VRHRRLYLSILLIFTILFIAINLAWVNMDKKVPVLSTLVYLSTCQEYYENLVEGDFFSFLMNRGNFYTPLLFQITSLFFFVLGVGYQQAVVSQVIFIFILVFSTFYLGEYLWNDHVGFAAALVSTVIPQMTFFTRAIGIDMPIAAVVPLCLLCLFKSDKFRDRKWSFFFFLCLAFGMLLKWSFIAYIFLPVAVYAYMAIKDQFRERETEKETIIFIAALFIFLLVFISSLTYIFSGDLKFRAGVMEAYYLVFLVLMVAVFLLSTFFIKFKSAVVGNLTGGIAIFMGLTAHFTVMMLIPMRMLYKVFWQVQYKLLLPYRNPYHFFIDFLIYRNFGIPYFILLIIGIFIYCLSKKRTLHRSILLFSMVFSMSFLLTLPVYDARYFMPLNAIAAFFIVFWILDLGKWFARIPLLILVSILGLFNIAGWMLPGGLAERIGCRTGMIARAPDVSINRLDEGASYILSLYRKERPERGMLVVVEDDSKGGEIVPLLVLYKLRINRNKDEQVAMLFRGDDPIYPSREVPWGFLITRGEEDRDESDIDDLFYLKDIHKDKDGGEKDGRKDLNIKDRLEGIDINKIDAGSVYFIRFRDASMKEKFPKNLLDQLKEKPKNFNRRPIKSIRILENDVMDVYGERKADNGGRIAEGGERRAEVRSGGRDATIRVRIRKIPAKLFPS